MSSLRFQILIGLLLSVLVFLQYKLWFESGGLRDMFQLKQSLMHQEDENKNLRAENANLLAEIRRLKHNDTATEVKARDELGMIKKGETYYQIVQ